MTTATLPAAAAVDVRLRPIEPDDANAAARILFDAFAGIHDRHRFPRDFPTPEAAAGLTSAFIAHPSIWGVVAEIDGRVVGSNFLDERGPIAGVGPITVDPRAQGEGVGRTLMQAVLERGSGAAGIRLLQDAFNTRSIALYASLGFEVKEPIALIGGTLARDARPSAEVRPLTHDDVPACERLQLAVHGFERTGELRDALDSPALEPLVAVRDGRVVAFATTLTFFPAAYATAETEADMWDLIAGGLAGGAAGSFLLPTRQHVLFRRVLDAGLRVVKPMTYMALGEHREPRGAWLPSVLY